MSRIFIAAVVLLTAAASGFAQDAERIAKARAEGQVVFYSTMGIDTVRPVTLAFEKKYPFLKVETLRLNSERVFNRVMVEHQTGKVHADVVNLSVMPLLKGKRVLASYRSPEANAFPAAICSKSSCGWAETRSKASNNATLRANCSLLGLPNRV